MIDVTGRSKNQRAGIHLQSNVTERAGNLHFFTRV